MCITHHITKRDRGTDWAAVASFPFLPSASLSPTTMMLRTLLIAFHATFLGTTLAFVSHTTTPFHNRGLVWADKDSFVVNGGVSPLSSTTSDTESTLATSLKELLESLDGPDGGKKLLDSSSASWTRAIFDALGAPDSADESIVAKSLQGAMSRPENQFAILMGKAEPFEANFPSDPVIDDATAWVECRLRHKETDKLLVTMGISLVMDNDKWLISALDWQDFRDAFYPGVSGREWLRAF